MADGSSVKPLDGAMCAPTIIGHWKLVIGHLIRRIHRSIREECGLGRASAIGKRYHRNESRRRDGTTDGPTHTPLRGGGTDHGEEDLAPGIFQSGRGNGPDHGGGRSYALGAERLRPTEVCQPAGE